MGCKTQTVLGGGREQGTEGELCLSTCSAFLGRNLTFLLLLDQECCCPWDTDNRGWVVTSGVNPSLVQL